MEFPLIHRELIANMKLVHGLFNFSVMCLLIYQGYYGLQIRKARKGSRLMPVTAVKRHRRMGPVLTGLGTAGFFAGLILVLLDTGKVFSYPVHLFGGIIILALICWTYMLSRQIRGGDSSRRDLHAGLGIAILAFYLVNIITGMGLLI